VHLGNRRINRAIPICVTSHNVVKASRASVAVDVAAIVVAFAVAAVLQTNFANVNQPLSKLAIRTIRKFTNNLFEKKLFQN
jgi:hypothetical protein